MKYNVNSIYSTSNMIKITVNQTGSKAMIRAKDQDKATMHQGFRVMADADTIGYGEWNTSERDLLLEVIKRERYARLAYTELYNDLIRRLNSIGLIQVPEEDNDDEYRF